MMHVNVIHDSATSFFLFKGNPFLKAEDHPEAATRGVLWKKVFLIKLQALLIKKETLAQVLFSCEFCEISKKNFFTEHLRTIASDHHPIKFFKAFTYQSKLDVVTTILT